MEYIKVVSLFKLKSENRGMHSLIKFAFCYGNIFIKESNILILKFT
jgi:hypothetical protein